MSKLIPLTQGQFAIVDDEDYQELMKYRWYAHYDKSSKGYYAGRGDYSGEKRKDIKMHRQIINTPTGTYTDHINHNTLDNRKCNLRPCTHSQNHMNQRKRSNNTSGITGVHWEKKASKWTARIVINQKLIHLGYFSDINEAAEVRRKAEIKYFGEFAYNHNA